MANSSTGFIAQDLEESIAAPGTGEGVNGPSCVAIYLSIEASISVSIIVACPPQWPPFRLFEE